ncbi:Myc-type, basic helix-loop-helix (bHLH) domain [Dillenia turbinata]|uniref:Myc-type, basic helix-loop-helix (BHLH) domain n=1 Tax=Dillenia turbinata TaxID=194707 RepID=A0AAN8ZIJ0_9MAGN
MEFLSSVPSFDLSDELFQFSPLPSLEFNFPQQNDLFFSIPNSGEFTTTGTSPQDNKPKRKKSSANSSDDHNNEKPSGHKKKKIIHRDIERQRRQEMATLYGSLRTLLPLKYLKGKRSISDHVHEAANYIKHMQKVIQDLNDKRDELKNFSNLETPHEVAKVSNEKMSGSCFKGRVQLNPSYGGGLEIVISAAPREEEVPLSKVLRALMEEGLSVINCTSTKVNEIQLHTIQSEICGEHFCSEAQCGLRHFNIILLFCFVGVEASVGFELSFQVLCMVTTVGLLFLKQRRFGC